MLRRIILCCLFVFVAGYKSISITPGGLKGFYMLGICKFLKETYDLNDYHLYGTSAGSWNALYLRLDKLDDDHFLQDIYKIKQEPKTRLYDIEQKIKNILIERIDRSAIDNLNISICIAKVGRSGVRKVIVSNFTSLDNLLECCIASSHLPILSNGNIFYKLNNMKCIDGGVFRRNYPRTDPPPLLIVSPKMFKNNKIRQFSKLSNLNIEMMVNEGYNDAKNNKKILDDCLL